MDCIAAAYESARDRMPGVSLEQFRAFAAGCDVHEIRVDGQTAGAIIVRGDEIHACVLPWACGRWMSRRTLSVLRGVIQQHGQAVTSATTEAGRQFVRRLGFRQQGDRWVLGGMNGN